MNNQPSPAISAVPQVIDVLDSFEVSFEKIAEDDEVAIYQLVLRSEQPARLLPLRIRWRLSAHDVQGVWSTNALYEKRLRADWEPPTVAAHTAVDAPVVCLFGHSDENVVTFACADVVNTVVMEAPVREEDNQVYCQLHFFTEPTADTAHFKTEIRIDQRAIPFSEALASVVQWWASYEHLQPATVPQAARHPVYSTWYAYHQNLAAETLLRECRQAATLGYGTIIIDDGWQTLDNRRGYDYTGDWQPERLPNLVEIAQEVHRLDMKLMLWYSVPFCGTQSKAYRRFKDKLLTNNHRWAPVLDPRYAEVRSYLIHIVVQALQQYHLDGFKLDFVDEFRTYPETELMDDHGRDYVSVNAAVDRLMSDLFGALRAIKPDILIEFRQKYIGPAMRKYGNMFRAFDCPNDSITNRVRTTDVRLLGGNSAVHADMLTWHRDEPVEIAALRWVNVLFSVPQLSVRLAEQSDDHLRMITFYTHYWNEHRALLTRGVFMAFRPLANYPLLSVSDDEHLIVGVYEDQVVNVEDKFQKIDLVNGKMSEQIAFELYDRLGKCSVEVYDCLGQIDWCEDMELDEGMHALEVPPAGLIQIKRLPSTTKI